METTLNYFSAVYPSLYNLSQKEFQKIFPIIHAVEEYIYRIDKQIESIQTNGAASDEIIKEGVTGLFSLLAMYSISPDNVAFEIENLKKYARIETKIMSGKSTELDKAVFLRSSDFRLLHKILLIQAKYVVDKQMWHALEPLERLIELESDVSQFSTDIDSGAFNSMNILQQTKGADVANVCKILQDVESQFLKRANALSSQKKENLLNAFNMYRKLRQKFTESDLSLLLQTKMSEKYIQSITRHIACVEFVWEMQRSLEIALFRTFASPRVSAILVSTGRLQRKTGERVERTDKLIMELLRVGYSSERGREIIEKLRKTHQAFDIRNDDYLFVLSTFIFEPIRWIDLFGKRKLLLREKEAWFLFWREVGLGMGIVSIPNTHDDMVRWTNAYELENVKYSEDNVTLTKAVIGFLHTHIKIPEAVIRSVLSSLLEKHISESMGLKQPYVTTKRLIFFLIRLKSRF